VFGIDSDAWRRLSNIHPFVMRHGVALDELTAEQRDRALALRRESLSAGGFRTARDVTGISTRPLLIVNCFVLGDQAVMTPMFMGSEPVAADTGPLAGTRVFLAEEQQGLALARSLTPEQRRRAVLAAELPTELFTAAFRDNFGLE
jgi:hypothetical protein